MEKKIRICVFGDFKATFPERIILDDKIKNIIDDADICVCNFESPVGDTEIKKKKNNLILNQPLSSAELLIRLGFNVVLLGNNHIMEHGEKECRDTINSFKDIITVGAGSPDEAYAVKTKEVCGKRIGFFSGVHHEFGVLDSPKDEKKCGVAWINAQETERIIREAKDVVDFLIVFPHAGVEHIFAPLPEWREVYRHFIDWGADAVIGSHPHTPQGWEFHKGKPIFYSLGDFYFDYVGTLPTEYWNKSLCVELIISDNNIESRTHNIIFKDGIIEIDDSESIKKHNIFLQELISDPEKYYKYIVDICYQMDVEYRYKLLRGLGGVSFSHLTANQILKSFVGAFLGKCDDKTLLNIFQCESHRWLIERIIKMKMNIENESLE